MQQPSRQDGSSGSPALARRLRELREQSWPDVTITQATLAEAFGGLAGSTISSWESPTSPTVPTLRRLAAYARFFATRRSVAGDRPHVLPDSELDDAERAERDRLLQELITLRQADPPASPTQETGAAHSSWHFPDGAPVRLICGRPPEQIQEQVEHPYANAASPNYVALLSYADTDALIELFGHIRAVNPDSDVRFKLADEVDADDLSGHVVLLGGLSTNQGGANRRFRTQVAGWFASRVNLPVRQVEDARVEDGEVFELNRDGKGTRIYPVEDAALGLTEDIGLLVRMPNPTNTATTLTICNGVYGRGVLGSVRCLTDRKLRDRNEAYLASRFGGSPQFGLLMRVSVIRGTALTPDLNNPHSRIYEWPE